MAEYSQCGQCEACCGKVERSNPIVETASVDDVNDLQAYTIHKIDQYMDRSVYANW